MRVLLIAPRSAFPDVTPGWLRLAQMSLLVVEALTGPEHEVTIVDEEVEPIPFHRTWDVVGITVMTATAPRAYELARLFRRTGARVVLGGMHPTLVPDEGTQHADAVVVGEAEGIWEQVLEDIRDDRLQPIYRNTAPDITRLPLVRYRTRPQKYPPLFNPVLASRGCPKECEFCSVHKAYGRRFRRLPVDRVIEQIRIRSTRDVMFLDDNLVTNRAWALELFTRLVPFKLRLISQVPASFMLDDELFSAAVRAGLKAAFVGVETIDERALSRFRKSLSVGQYVEAIRRCRGAKVLFHAALIFGMDEHDTSIFRQTLDFVLDNSVPSVSPYVLTPYPGTDLSARLEREGRLLHRNWAYYDHLTPVFEPSRMSFAELADGYRWFRRRLFGVRGILRRLPAQLTAEPIPYLCLNLAFRKTTALLDEHHGRYFRWLRSSPTGTRASSTFSVGAGRELAPSSPS